MYAQTHVHEPRDVVKSSFEAIHWPGLSSSALYIYSISSRILSYFSFFPFFFFTVLRAATPPPDIHRINEVNYCLKSSISIPSKRNNPPEFPFDFSFVSPSNRFLSNRMNNTMLRINFSNRVKLYAKIYFVTQINIPSQYRTSINYPRSSYHIFLERIENNLEIFQHRRVVENRAQKIGIERNYRDTPLSPQPASSQFTF